jgi:hypothetical protein
MMEQVPVVFLPDPILDLGMVSGATLLYFDGPFIGTTPPAVVTPEAFALLDLVASRRPSWTHRLESIVRSLLVANAAADKSWRALTAIAPDKFKRVYLSLPADREAFGRVDEMVSLSGFTYADLKPATIPTLSYAELARHIFLEMYVGLGQDFESLYDYCDSVLGVETTDALEVASYLLRLQALLKISSASPVLLTNGGLAPLFERLASLAPQGETVGGGGGVVDDDVVAWEFFRVLVSRIVDPLNEQKLHVVGEILRSRRSQVLRLRARCKDLVSELSEQTSVVGLAERVLAVIESRLRSELRELFELDERSWREYVTSLASDKSVWIAVSGAIAGLTMGGATFTMAGTIATLATIGSAAVKARASREDALRQSDLALLHVLRHRVR